MAIGPTINDIKEITSVLSEKLKMDFSNYAFSFLRRRFAYVFNELKVKNTSTFIEDIKKGKILDDFCYLFPVEETELFRDPSFWRTLRSKLIPNLSEDNLTFWFPDLTSGEELFSLLIVLKEDKVVEKAKIFCNVSSAKRINEIKEGKISAKNLDLNKSNFKRLEVESDFDDYFTRENGFLKLNSNLLSNVEFIQSNYFNTVPQSNINVTIFRNKMLYYNAKLQLFAENYLKNNLYRGSYFALGIKEKILKENESYFDIYDSGEQIYKVI